MPPGTPADQAGSPIAAITPDRRWLALTWRSTPSRTRAPSRADGGQRPRIQRARPVDCRTHAVELHALERLSHPRPPVALPRRHQHRALRRAGDREDRGHAARRPPLDDLIARAQLLRAPP